MGLFFLFVWFSRRFLQNQQIIRENQKYKRKAQKTKQALGKTKQPKFLKVSDSPLDMGLVFLVVWFSRRFLQNQQIIRENQQYKHKKNKQTNIRKHQTTNVFKGFRLTLGYVFLLFFVFVVFPNVLVLQNQQIIRENQTYQRKSETHIRENQTNNKTKKTYPRVGLKPLNTLFCCVVLMLVWFSLVFFRICGVLEGFLSFVKTFGKAKQKHIQGWV